ncbi:MAG: helix-turn-helix domain-containing protein [Rhodopseudomonas sp.]|uniref:transcriptional activatory protein AadR n=1 Tax=Rhodopseudomonas sp. TaxID=1078 RepID=UPI0017A78F0C|nr:transcriptional activatory protein AadR [Rhodopseudomonas sp.]NVN88007.1 helix-turn-helix domain-containing protein [Rhodopseudomonas sp.]
MPHLAFPNSCDGFRCETHCSVRSLAICGQLNESEHQEFERLAQHVRFGPKEALFSEDEMVDSVYSLTEGIARLYKLLPDGRRQIIGFALPGDFLGMAPSNRYSFSADAIGPLTVCKFFRGPFMRFIENRPQMLMRMNEFATRELGLAQDQMLLLGRRSAEEKVAAFLVGWRERLARLEGMTKTVTLPMGRQDIADFLGLTIETVSRTFTKLEREKLIVIVPDGVRVLDSKRFDALAAA